VHRAQHGGPQAPCVFQRRDGGQVVAVDKEQDDPAGVVGRLCARAAAGAVVRELPGTPSDIVSWIVIEQDDSLDRVS
jgi:hypothetical protein